mmetsp:Transcript_6823/g.6127  ORF Transcript_6823/g.6127 Transcript_6823/m.6127 type:complete len:310 (+) Transcript_6823:140-1069(+)
MTKYKVLDDFTKGQIVAHKAQGLSNMRISKHMSISRQTIDSFINKYNKTGDIGRSSGSGRPRITSTTDDRSLVTAVKRSPDRKDLTYSQMAESAGVNGLSRRTVARRLEESGEVKLRYSKKKIFVSPVNRKKRLKWCKDHLSLNWTTEEWRKVIWSDESPFSLRFKGKKRAFVLTEDQHYPNQFSGTVKHDKKVNVWGCFSYNGVGNLYNIEGIMVKQDYKNILQRQMIPSAQKLFPSGDYIFQEDNDPKHAAKICRQYLSNKGVNRLEWPSQSPDLNPIENLWAILDKKCKMRKPQNENQLFEYLKYE